MVYQFDRFTLDTARVELSTEGEQIPLEPKTYDVLRILVENRGRVVTKDEIFETVWPGVYVSEASISQVIKQLRRALGDSGETQSLIRTVRGKGFRFVAETSEVHETPASGVVNDPSPEASDQPQQGGLPVIAVLPLVLIKADDAHNAIAEGIAAEMISALSRLGSVKVIARGSSFRFDPAAPDYSAVRQQLGAGYVVSGAVEHAGSRLTISAELTETNGCRVVWSDTYAGSLEDVFNLRQAILREVCTAVDMHVPKAEADRLANVPTGNLDAWGHYHLGLRHLLRFHGAQNELAKQFLTTAIRLDPNFARAQSALAYAELEDFSVFSQEDRLKSRMRGHERAELATHLDPTDPFCNLVLARANWFEGDVDAALSWAERSVQLNANYAHGHYELGKFNAIACLGSEADRFATQALSLSPIDPHMPGMISSRALASFVLGDDDAAMSYAEASARAPNPHLYVFAIASAIYAASGESARASEMAIKVRRRSDAFNRERFHKLFKLRDPVLDKRFADGLDQAGLVT